MKPARASNTRSTLKRKARKGCKMAAFDGLPPPLRHWVAQEAVLPWSPRSVLRVWQRAMQETGGDDAKARAKLREVERRTLAADLRRTPPFSRRPDIADMKSGRSEGPV
ncbi:DUF6525 family protein [Pseudosulfitobacter sp. DSM 107133]|uniref:DUF6525 family protein n=1 Tax=Pseudosulfitobacter sp. DSM 107133 TaxID=2883100 RepID=UPI000DF3D4CF|nr:DUF6525 family protein [Pseudosulfitobacter sp. DSM 107133]UOA27644.1 hypothetical protein DSM107133_02374 [Pseudosulfitobacter sp. DSM 107133]